MNSEISINDLKISCIIGIHPHERITVQDLYIDIHMACSFQKSVDSDHIDNTIDYTKVTEITTELAVNKKYQLIETLAYNIISNLFLEFNEITSCTVHIKKPKAIPTAKFASVKLERKRD